MCATISPTPLQPRLVFADLCDDKLCTLRTLLVESLEAEEVIVEPRLPIFPVNSIIEVI